MKQRVKLLFSSNDKIKQSKVSLFCWNKNVNNSNRKVNNITPTNNDLAQMNSPPKFWE